jgi:mediator of RNA polymerase II transcription subunit 13
MLNPLGTQSAVFDLVACFHALWKDLGNHPCLVLQIIPMDFIATPGKLSFSDPMTLSLLAREVYDRCPLVTNGFDMPITSHNAIELASEPVEDINFRLVAEAPHNIMHEKTCLHIAYASSLDDNWVTAAWTDNTGNYHHQASYRKSKDRSLNDIMHEIWASTMEYIGSERALWRLFVVSTNSMALAERKMWRNLAVGANKLPFKFNLTLISIDTSPLVDYYPTAIQSKRAHHNFVGDGTGRPSIASPKPMSTSHHPFSPTTPSTTTPRSMPDTTRPLSSNIPGISNSSPVAQITSTPLTMPSSLDNDPSTRLIDLTDETCGIILARHLNVSQSIAAYHPALASGYLFKRGGVLHTDRPILLEVNIMAVDLTAAATPTTASTASQLIPAATLPRAQQATPSRLPQRPNPALPSKPPTPLSSTSMFAAPSPAASTFPAASSTSSATPLSDADKSALRQRRYNAALREVLIMYRNLAVLAKVRGLQGVEGTAPWHVVVAMRAAEGLRLCVGGALPGKMRGEG